MPLAMEETTTVIRSLLAAIHDPLATFDIHELDQLMWAVGERVRREEQKLLDTYQHNLPGTARARASGR